MSIEIVVTNVVSEVKSLVAAGFCPVECSIGGRSIVDELVMDHHGDLSHLESVAIRAYRDHFAARAADPRFVICGTADADATFAVAALAGLLPHPQRKVAESLPPPVKASMTKDLSALATTVAKVDCSPIGLNIPTLPGGDILLTWNAMSSVTNRTSLGALQGVGLWVTLTEGNPVQLRPFLEAAKASEAARVQASLADLERGEQVGGVLVVMESRVFGFPEWYQRDEAGAFEAIEGWKAPVVLAWTEKGRNATIGCPNDQVAIQLFGPGGLKNVFAHLPGWGGRESVGGSPRGVELHAEEVFEAARVVDSKIIR